MAAPVVSAEIKVHIVESTWFVFCVSPTVLCATSTCAHVVRVLFTQELSNGDTGLVDLAL